MITHKPLNRIRCASALIGAIATASAVAGCNSATSPDFSQAQLADPGGSQTSSPIPTPSPSPSPTPTSTMTHTIPAKPLNYVVYVGAEISMSKANILAANSDPLFSLGALGIPTNNGQVTDAGSNYVFHSNTVGFSRFTYSIVDGDGNVGSATINVNVIALDKWAGSFYGTDGGGNIFVLDSYGALVLAQSATYNGSPVGFNDLAMTSSGTLYGKSYNTTTGINAIYSVSGSTGVATQISANLNPTVTTCMAGFTFLPDGRVVTAVSTDHFDGVSGPVSLVAVDPNTQVMTTLVPQSAGYIMGGGDVKLLPDGFLYWTVQDSPGSMCGRNGNQDIVRVDPATGAVTEVGCMGIAGVYGLGDIFGQIVGFSGSGNLMHIDLTNAHTSLIESTGHVFAGGTSNPLLWNSMQTQ